MKNPNRHYDKPLVPEYMTKLTIDKLPLDEPFYVTPGDIDDGMPPRIYVTQDRQLKMSRSFPISIEDAHPNTPLGLVGVMHTLAYYKDEETNKLIETRELFIADLRFIDFHNLVDTNDTTEAIGPELRAEALAYFDDSIVFSGFIAPEYDPDSDAEIPKSVYFGPDELLPQLKRLKKNGDRALKKFFKVHEAHAARQEADDELEDPEETSVDAKEKVGQKAVDCAVVFLEPGK